MNLLKVENDALKKSLAELRKDYRLLKAQHALKTLELAHTDGVLALAIARRKKFENALYKLGGIMPQDLSFVALQSFVKKVLGK